MQHIIAAVLSLVQHITLLNTQSSSYRPTCCLFCGKTGLWIHGSYPRKADRSGELNPLFIPRFFCPHCHRTCSALPECIPPRRWYLWEMQQMALSLLLAGASLRAVEKEILPSRSTIRRWLNRFKEQFCFHKDVLCNHIADLGRTIDFFDFWKACLDHFSLAQAMRLCHVAGVPIP
jgi:transposase-like protein